MLLTVSAFNLSISALAVFTKLLFKRKALTNVLLPSLTWESNNEWCLWVIAFTNPLNVYIKNRRQSIIFFTGSTPALYMGSHKMNGTAHLIIVTSCGRCQLLSEIWRITSTLHHLNGNNMGNLIQEVMQTSVFHQRRFSLVTRLTPVAFCKLSAKFYQVYQTCNLSYQIKLGQSRFLA